MDLRRCRLGVTPTVRRRLSRRSRLPRASPTIGDISRDLWLKADVRVPQRAVKLYAAAGFYGLIRGLGMTSKQFCAIAEPGGDDAAGAEPVMEGGARSVSQHQVILGVDPSLRGTGYGVIRWAGRSRRPWCMGQWFAHPAGERSRCLVKIAQTLREVIRQHHPTVCVVRKACSSRRTSRRPHHG